MLVLALFSSIETSIAALEKLKTTQKGKFLSDGISADLFKLNVS